MFEVMQVSHLDDGDPRSWPFGLQVCRFGEPESCRAQLLHVTARTAHGMALMSSVNPSTELRAHPSMPIRAMPADLQQLGPFMTTP